LQRPSTVCAESEIKRCIPDMLPTWHEKQLHHRLPKGIILLGTAAILTYKVIPGTFLPHCISAFAVMPSRASRDRKDAVFTQKTAQKP
jgi:hypothetical protein